MSGRSDHAREIRYALVDVRAVCERLGLLGKRGSFLWQARGVIVRCPWHEERTPSCSVRIAGDGTIAVRCHGCGASGDVLSLIAQARGLSVKRDFRDVLREGAEMGGLWGIVQELETGREVADRPRVEPPKPTPDAERTYPEAWELLAVWNACGCVSEDDEVRGWLKGRSLDADAVEGRDLARALPSDGRALPRWARYQGRSWSETGHRLIVPMRGADGAILSVRAGRVRDGESPKRLPPGGHKASELVMADEWGVAMLGGERQPERIVIVEGEPDFLTWASRLNDPRTATIGIVSGSWHAALAARFPVGARVVIRTDHDRAGDAYAAEVAGSLRKRCFVRRSASPEVA